MSGGPTRSMWASVIAAYGLMPFLVIAAVRDPVVAEAQRFMWYGVVLCCIALLVGFWPKPLRVVESQEEKQ